MCETQGELKHSRMADAKFSMRLLFFLISRLLEL
jgi:hypothetical protein